MLTRRQLLYFAAVSTLGSVSTSVRARNFDYWPIDLKSLEPISHSLFGKHPLEISNRFQIGYDRQTLIQNNQIPDSQFDIRGVGIHIAENGFSVPMVVRNIFTTKVALVLEKHGDRSPNLIAVYKLGNAFVNELSTRINFQGFSSEWRVFHRVWALTESNDQILCAYVNIRHVFSCDGC